MAQRRHHYEQAFEAFLRDQRIPYVAVNEAKKALVPRGLPGPDGGDPQASLKTLCLTGNRGDECQRGFRPRRPTLARPA